MGGPPGDLFVKIRVKDHHLFGQSGGDLTLDVPITFDEAALGADIAVPTLDGGSVKMRIPAGTPSGKTFRLRGKGGKGDLLVTAVIVVPDDLSDEHRITAALRLRHHPEEVDAVSERIHRKDAQRTGVDVPGAGTDLNVIRIGGGEIGGIDVLEPCVR